MSEKYLREHNGTSYLVESWRKHGDDGGFKAKVTCQAPGCKQAYNTPSGKWFQSEVGAMRKLTAPMRKHISKEHK